MLPAARFRASLQGSLLPSPSVRFHPRLTLLFCALALTASGASAQGRARTRRPAKKPFAAFSESAERLLGRVTAPTVDSSAPAPGPFARSMEEDSLINVARSQLGARYRLGAAQPNKAWDCSALVRFVMGALRIDLPRTAHEQSQVGTAVDRDLSHLKPGDLLTFGRTPRRVTHIGVYVGDGKFVHASTSARRVVESSITKGGTWYTRNWIGVRRLLATTENSDTTRTY